MLLGDVGVVELDRRAVALSLGVVRQVGPDDLHRRTPCAGWTLRNLVEHMTAQHYLFAVASRGRGADPRSWLPPGQQDPLEAYADSAGYVAEALAAPGALRRELVLPQISSVPLPFIQAISLHVMEFVVHSWDVARSLGRPFDVADDLAGAALSAALRVPDGRRRLVPGAAFRPGLPAASEATAMERALATLGRSPDWPD
jgi:uncharacterized protein (TIGR03086 family)